VLLHLRKTEQPLQFRKGIDQVIRLQLHQTLTGKEVVIAMTRQTAAFSERTPCTESSITSWNFVPKRYLTR
jgi:hypothetical protein